MSSTDNSILASVVRTSHQETTYRELIQECIHNPPSMCLSPSLRKALESMQPGARSEVVESKHIGCAPLLLASMRGNVKIVKYLVHVCGADVEQWGVDVDNQEFKVTPLWSAAANGHLSVVRVLAGAGADLNAAALSSGSTPVSAACQNKKYSVVSFLVRNGADINRPDRDGGTCLMKSVHCMPLCLLLIKRVNNVNACNINKETALHFSVRKKNTESMTLLLENGANPYARSNEGADALQLACLQGSASMVDLLIDKVFYLPERRADMYELLAATLLENYNHVEGALSKWREALLLRLQYELPKRPEMVPHEALQFMREFRTEAELAAATDEQELHTQALLVFERVLNSRGRHHRVFSDQLMKRGLKYANAFLYQRCIDLWTWALEGYLRNSLVEWQYEICITARELTRLFQNMHANHAANASFLHFQNVFRVFSLLADSLPAVRRAVTVQTDMSRPRNEYKYIQEAVVDGGLIYIMHLLHLLLTIVEEATQEERKNWKPILYKKLCWLVAQDVRSVIPSGNTMLHFSVLKIESIHSRYFFNEQIPDVQFPSLRCVQALLAAGASVNIRNFSGCSPLYMAADSENFNAEIVLELLKAGAHLDQPDCDGRTPASILAANPACNISLPNYLTLACLAASAVARYRINVPPGELPKTLLKFLRLHQT